MILQGRRWGSVGPWRFREHRKWCLIRGWGRSTVTVKSKVGGLRVFELRERSRISDLTRICHIGIVLECQPKGQLLEEHGRASRNLIGFQRAPCLTSSEEHVWRSRKLHCLTKGLEEYTCQNCWSAAETVFDLECEVCSIGCDWREGVDDDWAGLRLLWSVPYSLRV